MAVDNKTPVYMQVPRRLKRQRRGFTQNQLNAWLDEQERIIRERALPDEIVFCTTHRLLAGNSTRSMSVFNMVLNRAGEHFCFTST